MRTKPVKYTPEALKEKFIEYLHKCIEECRFPNVKGFTIYIDLHRSVYYDYKAREEYKETIEYIEDALEEESIQQLITAKNPAGVIFYLKNKFDYKDKKEIQTNTSTNVLVANASKEELIESISKMLSSSIVDAECKEIQSDSLVTGEE